MTRREFTISLEYAARFLSAAEAGSKYSTGIRQLPIWMEMAFVLGFDVASVERSDPDRPTVFVAVPVETASRCTSEGAVRCPEKPHTVIDGEMFCEHHAEWVREDAAKARGEEAGMSPARRAQIAYDRAVMDRIEALGLAESERSVRS